MKNNNSLLENENRWGKRFLWSLVAAVISGFCTYIIAGHNTWQQWTSLLHVFVGLFLTILVLPYLVPHFKRTLVTRRALTILTGLVSAGVLLLLIVSGIQITLFGQMEAQRWIYNAHIYTAIGLVALLGVHIFFHWATISYSKKRAGEKLFLSFKAPALKLCGIMMPSLILAVIVATVTYGLVPSSYKQTPDISPYQLPYGNHPFAPAQTETDNNTFIDEKIIAGSERCAACHEQIAREWRSSIHGKAAADQSYVTNIKLLVQKKGIAAARYCESCHAPVALLTGQLTEGGKHGGEKGTTAFLQGVSCMACHGIERVKNLKGVGSYHFTPPQDYLFAGSRSYLPTKLHNFLIRINPELHKKELAKPVLFSPKLCATCHVQHMDKEVNNWGWVKMQDQYESWLKSPFSGQGEQTFSNIEAKRCQDCHFQHVQGDDPSANQFGTIASHRNIGGNTAVPWLDSDYAHFDMTRRFLQSGKVRIDIEEPRRNDATQSRRTLKPESRDIEPPYYLYLGETAKIKAIVTNQLVGHDFPAGATDISETWIHFKVSDSQGRTVYESGGLNIQNEVEPNAHFYRSIPIDKDGNQVWKHDLFNMVGTQYKNTIPAGSSDIVEYQFEIPYWAKSPLIISATVRCRNFNQKYARWALKQDNIELPIVDLAQDTLSVPIRIRSEVDDHM